MGFCFLLSAFCFLVCAACVLARGNVRELPSARAEMELPSALSAQLSPLRHVDEVADLLQALHVQPRETPKRGDRIAQLPFETKALITRLEALEDYTFSRLTDARLGSAQRTRWCSLCRCSAALYVTGRSCWSPVAGRPRTTACTVNSHQREFDKRRVIMKRCAILAR